MALLAGEKPQWASSGAVGTGPGVPRGLARSVVRPTHLRSSGAPQGLLSPAQPHSWSLPGRPPPQGSGEGGETRSGGRSLCGWPQRETLPSLSLSPRSGASFQRAAGATKRACRKGCRLPWWPPLLWERLPHPFAPPPLGCGHPPRACSRIALQHPSPCSAGAAPGPSRGQEFGGRPCSLPGRRRCGGGPAHRWSCRRQGLRLWAAAPSGEGADKQRSRASGKGPLRVKVPGTALQGPRHLSGPVVPQGAGPRSGELGLGTVPGPCRHAPWHGGPGRPGGVSGQARGILTGVNAARARPPVPARARECASVPSTAVVVSDCTCALWALSTCVQGLVLTSDCRPQVPLKVSLSAGRSWGHLVPLQEALRPQPSPRPAESPGNHPAPAGPLVSTCPPPVHFSPSFCL